MSKFKQGDRVFIPKGNIYATVIDNKDISSAWNEPLLFLRRDDGFKFYCLESNCTHPDITTAFLTELQNLLRKYEAVICGSPTENVFILIGENKIKCSDSWIGSENIFDYEMRYKIEQDVDEPDYNLANILKPDTEIHQYTLEEQTKDQTKYGDF